MVKRGFDLVGAGLLLLVLTPLILVAAAVSLLSYGRWPFFAQPRVGRGGHPFRVLKVRTLHPRTPRALPKAGLEAHRPNRACRFLRAHHLDELPQLANVVAGSMSLVGPRPEMVELVALLPPAFAERRAQVRPGLTGLWQVSDAVEAMIADRPEFDEFYLEAHCLRLDLWVLGRTVVGLLGRRPITGLHELPRWARPEPQSAARGIGDRAA